MIEPSDDDPRVAEDAGCDMGCYIIVAIVSIAVLLLLAALRA